MAEGNISDGHRKTRLALGDLTNRLGKRGFSSIEKAGIKSFNFNDKDKGAVKRLCVSPRPCTEINSLKGNVISGISKVPTENKEPNLSHIGSVSSASKSSIDVETDCKDGHSINKKNVVMGKEKVHGGTKDTKILDLSGGDTVSGNVYALNVIDVDSCGEIDCSGDQSGQGMDGIADKNSKNPNLENPGRGRAVNSVATKEDVILGIAEAVSQNKCSSFNHNVGGNVTNGGGEVDLGNSQLFCNKNDPKLFDLGRGTALGCANTETNDELGDISPADTSRTVSETGTDCPNDDVNDSNISSKGIRSDVNAYQHDMEAYNFDNLGLSQSGSIDCTILPESQESRVFGVAGSTELKKGEECAYMNGGTDSTRSCSCTFCTKAAYIWLDLNYQDIKARISALKKSQKEAIILAERSSRNKAIGKHGAQSFKEDSNLESHLIYQWRSLFQHMANIWDEESNQLETSLLPLTDLREKCKTDLEFVNATPSEKC